MNLGSQLLTFQGWANNAKFPIGKDGVSIGGAPILPVTPIIPTATGPGLDAIIGMGPNRSLVGIDPADATKSLSLDANWVIPKGGEYFFSPSISAITNTFAQAV
jgi:hypothetical protein